MVEGVRSIYDKKRCEGQAVPCGYKEKKGRYHIGKNELRNDGREKNFSF